MTPTHNLTASCGEYKKIVDLAIQKDAFCFKMDAYRGVRRKTIDAATARRLSVEASCDPRTIQKVLRGEDTGNLASIRARRVLIRAGLLNSEDVQAA